jgi:hypothetical protein
MHVFMRPGRIACLALFTTIWFASPALAQRRAQVEPPTAPPQPQTLAEFLNSLADNALTADPSQLYRVDGKRRTIALGGGWLAALDEQASGRLVNAGTGPGTAGPPGKALEITQHGPTTRVRL